MKRSSRTMKSTLTGFAAVLLAGSLYTGYAADVTGKITLKGTPKPEGDIDLGPSRTPPPPKKPPPRHYVVGKDGGLANVFVYLKKDGLKAAPQGTAPTLDQHECMYQPYVFGVVTGQPFKIKNSDALLHNIHATPRLNKEFNFGQPVKDQVGEKSFDTAEVLVRVKCD